MAIDNHGHSQYTAEKQRVFRGICKMQFGIMKGVIARHPWPDDRIAYIDITAGAGGHHDGTSGKWIKGSPLIALEELYRLKCDHTAVLIEQSGPEYDSLVKLTSNYADVKTICADHCDLIGNDNLLPRVKTYRRCYLGMLYSDPNGNQSWDALAAFSNRIAYSHIDILLHINACSVKRSRGAGYQSGYMLDHMESINKTCWLVGKPMTCWQWTFALGTNWCDQPAWEKRGFVRAASAEGRKRLEYLTYSKAERVEQICL